MAEDAAQHSKFPTKRLNATWRTGTYAIPVALVVVFAVSIAVRVWLTRDIVAPWIMSDELQYSELAKSFAASGEFLIREYPTVLYTLYAVLIAPAWASDSNETAYTASKVINVGLMTLAAVPVYYWARRVATPGYAVVATALTLAMPAFVYTGMLMTENAFFPAFVLACFAMALALERPTLVRQAFMFGAIGVTCLVRVQGVVLVAMLVVAIVLKAFLDLRATGTRLTGRSFVAAIRPYWVSLATLVVGAFAYLVLQALRGASVAAGLGAYGITGEAGYSRNAAGRWFLYHLGELGYSVGIIPVCALIVCFGLATRWKADFTAAERAFLAVAAASVLLVAQVAIYASRFAFRIEERNMFHVAPLLFIALAIWLSRGLPRPSRLTAVAVLVPSVLLFTVPFEGLFTISLLSDSFAMVPLLRLTQRLAGGTEDVRVLLGLGLLGAGLLFAVVPRRIAALLVPTAIAALLVVSSVATFRGVRFQSVGARSTVGPGDTAWIDHAIGREPRAAFLYTPEIGSPHTLWQTEFWNRGVGNVYEVQVEAPGDPGSAATVDAVTGRITVVDPRGRFPPEYAVGAVNAQVVGDVVATSGALALTRVSPPLRVSSRQEGIYGDAWMGRDAAYNHYGAPDATLPRAFRVTLSRAAWHGPDVPGDVRVRIGPIERGPDGLPQIRAVTAERTWVIHRGKARTFVLPAPPPPFRAEVHISPTFSPLDYGQPDARQLGAQVAFEVTPKIS